MYFIQSCFWGELSCCYYILHFVSIKYLLQWANQQYKLEEGCDTSIPKHIVYFTTLDIEHWVS